MNITIIIGWVIAFGMVVFGIFQGGQIDWFIDPPSLAITIGGTIGCLIASYPLSYLAGLGKRFKLVFMPKKFNPEKYIDDIVEYAKIARGRGLLALEESANQCTDQFMKSGGEIAYSSELNPVTNLMNGMFRLDCQAASPIPAQQIDMHVQYSVDMLEAALGS